ncbi:MAG: hypothetical protein J5543_01475 [Bacteroidales bacterium]|nr:hypothetical protein [Bacteroidales bacterium]
MLKEQLIMRLLLIVIVGIVYVRTMLKMAIYKNCETTKQKHVVLKVLGGLSLLVCVIAAFSGIYLLTQMEYPSEPITFSYTASVRPSSSKIVWGYPTSLQIQAIMMFNNIFTGLGLAAYCFCFKSSNTTLWKKIMKFLCGVFLFGLFCSATDFHYFDLQEWVIPILYCVMVYYISKTSKEAVIPTVSLEQDLTKIDFSNEIKTTENISRYMPEEIRESSCENSAEKNQEQNASISEEQFIEYTKEQAIKEPQDSNISEVKESSIKMCFCRHCGKKIDYAGANYCKYCGKIIN